MLATVLAASTIAVAVPHVHAAVSCTSARSNYFDGKHASTSTTYGARATIETFYPALCTGGTSTFSAAWSMLAYPSLNDGGWGQSGYVKDTAMGGSTVYYFAQWKKNGSETAHTLYTSPGPASGDTVTYSTYVNANGYLEMYRGSTLMARSTWKPATAWGPQPWSNQYFGEAGQCQTDVPGLEWNRASFTGVKYRSTVGGPWLTTSGLTGLHDCGSTYQYSTVSSTAFDIWTYRP